MEFEVQVVRLTRAWIGTPYVHQASCRGAGTDCLGLIRGVWRDIFGHEPCAVPGYTQDWGECGSDEILLSAAKRWLVPLGPSERRKGSVLLFRMRDDAIAKHLGILVEDGALPRFVHAYSGHGVVESPLSEPWNRRVVSAFAFPVGE